MRKKIYKWHHAASLKASCRSIYCYMNVINQIQPNRTNILNQIKKKIIFKEYRWPENCEYFRPKKN